jgi:hypothetical protein
MFTLPDRLPLWNWQTNVAYTLLTAVIALCAIWATFIRPDPAPLIVSTPVHDNSAALFAVLDAVQPPPPAGIPTDEPPPPAWEPPPPVGVAAHEPPPPAAE